MSAYSMTESHSLLRCDFCFSCHTMWCETFIYYLQQSSICRCMQLAFATCKSIGWLDCWLLFTKGGWLFGYADFSLLGTCVGRFWTLWGMASSDFVQCDDGWGWKLFTDDGFLFLSVVPNGVMGDCQDSLLMGRWSK